MEVEVVRFDVLRCAIPVSRLHALPPSAFCTVGVTSVASRFFLLARGLLDSGRDDF